MHFFTVFTDLHTFDAIDGIALRGTSTLLLLAGLARWLIAEGKVTLKHHRQAKDELLRQKEAEEKRHAKHNRATAYKTYLDRSPISRLVDCLRIWSITLLATGSKALA